MHPCVMGAGDRVPTNLPIDGHSFRRVEGLTGTPRRRRWSDAEKAAIVAESLAHGARTSEIALRHGLDRNQLYEWRRQFRSAADGRVAPDFVPVVAEPTAVRVRWRSRSRLAVQLCGLGRGSSLAFWA